MDLIKLAIEAIADLICEGIAKIIDVIAMAVMQSFTPGMNSGELFDASKMGVSDRMHQVFPFFRQANHIFYIIAFAMIALMFIVNIMRSFKPGNSREEGIFTHLYRAILAVILTALSYSLISAAMYLGAAMINYTMTLDYKVTDDSRYEFLFDGEVAQKYISEEESLAINDDIEAIRSLERPIREGEVKVYLDGLSAEEKEMLMAQVSVWENELIAEAGSLANADYSEYSDFNSRVANLLSSYVGQNVRVSPTQVDTNAVGSGMMQMLDNVIETGSSGVITASFAFTVIGPVILMIAIFWNFVKLFIEMAERLVVTTFVTSLAPLGFCSIASKETEGILFKYLQMVFSTYLVYILDIWFLKAFIYSIANVTVIADVLHLFWTMVLWLALLITAQKADQHLREAGLSVAQAGGNLLGEMMLAGRMLTNAGRNGQHNALAGTRLGNAIGARTAAPQSRQTGHKGVDNALCHYLGKDAARDLQDKGLATATNGSHYLEPKRNNGKDAGFKAQMAGKSGNAIQLETFSNAEAAAEAGYTPFNCNGTTIGVKGDRDDVAALTGAYGGEAAPVISDDAVSKFDSSEFDEPISDFTADEQSATDDGLDRSVIQDPNATPHNAYDMAQKKAKAEDAATSAEGSGEAEVETEGSLPMEGNARAAEEIASKAQAIRDVSGMSDEECAKAASGAESLINNAGLGSDGSDKGYTGCMNYSRSSDPAYVTRTKAIDNATGQGVEFQTVPAEYAKQHPDMFEGRKVERQWTDSKTGKTYNTYKSSSLNTKEKISLTNSSTGKREFSGNVKKSKISGMYTYKTPNVKSKDGTVVQKGKVMALIDPECVTVPKAAKQVSMGNRVMYICEVDKVGNQKRR